MFPYRFKYTETAYDIQDNDLLYKIDQQYQNTFECLENGKIRKCCFIIYIISIIKIWFVCKFCNFYISTWTLSGAAAKKNRLKTGRLLGGDTEIGSLYNRF